MNNEAALLGTEELKRPAGSDGLLLAEVSFEVVSSEGNRSFAVLLPMDGGEVVAA